MKEKSCNHILIHSIIGLMIALLSSSGSLIRAENVHVPDFSTDCGGYHSTDEGISLRSDAEVKPLHRDSLKITVAGATGTIRSPVFPMRSSARTTRIVKGNDLALWSVKYCLKNRLTRGTCRVRLRVLAPEAPYEIGFEHFGGSQTSAGGFTCIHKPLCAIVSAHPHVRRAFGDGKAELIVAFDSAEGDVWLGDVEITTAEPGGPGFSDEEWNAFETADGIHHVGVTANMFQPEYTPKAPGGYASRLVMDSAHKLFRAAGFNMVRIFTYWNDRNAHYPATQHQVIIWNSDPEGGTGDYDESLSKLRDGVDNLAYYGLRTMLCLRGSPDWSHPRHENNAETADREGPDLYANPGDPNGLGDPYFGDRVDLTENYNVWGVYNGACLQNDREGNNGDRIKAEVICNRQMRYGSSQTVILRATNTSATTFHDVRLWPVGFVDALGFEPEDIRSADACLPTLAPGQKHEIELTVKPRTTRVRAAGAYKIGLAVVNREGKHSLSLTPLAVLAVP